MASPAIVAVALALLAGTLQAAAPGANLLLLDGALVGADVIAVGERGAIRRSADQGRTWEACASPARATLTGISFATLAAPRLGWAVGHDATILATTDAGRTWTLQYRGENLQDSFLDVLALDAQRVIAVGAYGLCLTTNNGGATWTRRKVLDDELHLNRITRGGTGTIYLAGERGTLLRSEDSGATWTAMPVPYTGSFYGILPVDRGVLLAYGLRGNVFRSTDDGRSWQAVASPVSALLASAVRLKSGAIVLAGQARTLLVSREPSTLVSASQPPSTSIAELLELPDGQVLALGEAGATRLSPP